MYRTNQFNQYRNPLKFAIPFARLIPVNSDDGEKKMAIVLNKDGSMQTTWNYCGPDLGATVSEELAQITQQLNHNFMTIDSGFVFYFEADRHPSTAYRTDSYFPDPLTQYIDEERQQFFSADQHYISNFYCTLYWVPPTDTEDRMNELIVEGRKHKDPSVEDQIQKFKEMADKIIASFRLQQIPSTYLDEDETLTYLHSTISDNDRTLKMPPKPMLLDQLMYDSPLYGGLTPRLGKKHLRVVTPTKFAAGTAFGFFDALNQLNFSYRWVSRYYCLSKPDSINDLEKVKKQWYGKIKPLMSMVKEIVLDKESSGNENVNAAQKFDETKDAIAAVENDTTSYGYYSTAIVIMDDTMEGVEAKAKEVVNLLMALGLNAKSEGLNAIDAWMGTIPGNVGRFVRRPIISTGNLVHMMPLSNIWAGTNENKCLDGPPLLYTQTAGNTPFRMNLHVHDVGHSMMVGRTGGGKSVHLNLIEAQWRKYKNAKVFIFDKGASSIALTLGVGGSFYDLGNEKQGNISFQPLRNVDDPQEMVWLLGWIKDFLECTHFTVKAEHSAKILAALKTIAADPNPKYRRMTNFVRIIQDQALQVALNPLCTGGPYGNIFDSTNETLNFGNWQTFEMEKLMGQKEIIGSTLMYIFHRIEQALDGSPTIIVLDECWVFFSNEQFSKKIAEWLRVLRKSNASVLFATQQIEDIVNSPIFDTVNTNCSTKIFLPDKRSITPEVLDVYRKFGLNRRQVDIINQATLKQDYYYNSILGARLYNLALGACPITMAFIAVNTQDVKEAKRLMHTVPLANFRREWLKYKKIDVVEEDIDEAEKWQMEE